MRVLIEVLLIAGLIAFAVAYGPVLWRRARMPKKPAPAPFPVISAEATRLALSDDRLREAVDLRNKIAGLAKKKDAGLDVVVVHEVDELVAAMVSLREMKVELSAHLATISEDRISRDAALLDAESVANQKRQLEGLRQRERSLESELARAVAGLRETWLGLLDALAQPGSANAASLSADRIRSQIETLRIRIQAEREARTEVETEVETA